MRPGLFDLLIALRSRCLHQREIALKAGITEQTFSGIMNRRLLPSLDEMNRIAAAIGVDAGDVFPASYFKLQTIDERKLEVEVK